MPFTAQRKLASRQIPSPRKIAIVLGAFAVVFALALGTQMFVARPQTTSGLEPEPASVSSIASGESTITVIVSKPNSDDCYRYELNAATGARKEKGTTKCVSDGGSPGSRGEAIAKGFRSR